MEVLIGIFALGDIKIGGLGPKPSEELDIFRNYSTHSFSYINQNYSVVQWSWFSIQSLSSGSYRYAVYMIISLIPVRKLVKLILKNFVCALMLFDKPRDYKFSAD